VDDPDLTRAEVFKEAGPGRSVAQGTWHVVPDETGLAQPWFVPDAPDSRPQKAIITVEMLLDTNRFTRIA
jgi:hypothetical protein